jgi:hypothetical protein
MLLNMKLSILRLLFIMSLFLFIPRVSAQDCNTAFPYGRNAYLDGQYQTVLMNLMLIGPHTEKKGIEHEFLLYIN